MIRKIAGYAHRAGHRASRCTYCKTLQEENLNYQAVKLVPIRNTWASDFSYILYGNFSHTFCMGISSTLGAQKGHFSTPLIEPKPILYCTLGLVLIGDPHAIPASQSPASQPP